MTSITRFALRHRRLVALAWIALAVAGALATSSATGRMTHSFATPGSPGYDAGFDELTARELEVLGLVAEGLSNLEIAARLHLSPLTAKTHVSRILTKLRARDRVQLVVMSHELGLAGRARRG